MFTSYVRDMPNVDKNGNIQYEIQMFCFYES